MIVYQAARRRGKTSTVVDWMLEKPAGERVVVVVSASAGDHFFRYIVRKLGDDAAKPYRSHIWPWAEATHRSRGRDAEIAIDNADAILRLMFGRNIRLLTMEKEDDNSADT